MEGEGEIEKLVYFCLHLVRISMGSEIRTKGSRGNMGEGPIFDYRGEISLNKERGHPECSRMESLNLEQIR